MPVSHFSGVPSTNYLLAALPPGEHQRLLHHLELVSLPRGTILHQPGQAISHVFFPQSGVISLLTGGKKGEDLEVGLVGREGMVGLPVFLEDGTAHTRCLVQIPGEALRMSADDFRVQVARDSALHGLLLRYTRAFLAHLAQSIACNARHSVEKRCCRWLLTARNRVGADQFPLTHQFLASRLGVRRASVTEVARQLQQQRLIRYTRGQVTILDQEGLEAVACACYGVIQAAFDRMRG